MPYYLINGGLPLKNIKFDLLRREVIKSPCRDFQIVDNSYDNVFNILADWSVSTPYVDLIFSSDEICNFKGNLLELDARPMLDYIPEINVLFVSFS